MTDRYADLRAALDDGWVQSIHPDTVRTLLADYDRMRDALEWYSSMSKKMGNAAIHQDSQAMLTLMKEIAVDYGKRARAALAQEQGGSDE